MVHETPAGAYYHLVDFHGLDPQSAFREGEAGDPVEEPLNWCP